MSSQVAAEVSVAEREHLVRLCYRFTGDTAIADDLAQEALVKAWQSAGRLRDPERRAAWLAAIARNECRRWLRQRGREPAMVRPAPAAIGESDVDVTLDLADGFDLAAEIERHELARMLDRATALLPEMTRHLLVERYVTDVPLSEIAIRQGTSPATIAVRLHRARLALRRVLLLAFPAEVAELGLAVPEESADWRTTPIWCPWCGQEHLGGLFERDLGVFRLRCPTCGPINDSRSMTLFADATGYRAALMRLLVWCGDLYQQSQVASSVPCLGCGNVVLLRREAANTPPTISYFCPRCGGGTRNGQRMNVLALPESRRFWQQHSRVRWLPEHEIAVANRLAIVTGLVSQTSADRLEVIYARDTLEVLAVHRSGRRC